MGWTDAETKAYYAEQDAIYAAQVKLNQWPQDRCGCASRGCCQRFNHHHGECCLHCGNDERNPREWRHRGKLPQPSS